MLFAHSFVPIALGQGSVFSFPRGNASKLSLPIFTWIPDPFLLCQVSVSLNLGERICSLPVLDTSKNLLPELLFYLESIEKCPLAGLRNL